MLRELGTPRVASELCPNVAGTCRGHAALGEHPSCSLREISGRWPSLSAAGREKPPARDVAEGASQGPFLCPTGGRQG